MKPQVAFLIIAVACLFGYLIEPSLRETLVSENEPEKPKAKPLDADKDNQVSDNTNPKPPTDTSTPSAVPDWAFALKPDQMPEKVVINQPADFLVPGAAQAMVMPAGTEVTPLRIDETMLVIGLQGGGLEAKVPIRNTNLVEVLGGKPADVPAIVGNDTGVAIPSPDGDGIIIPNNPTGTGSTGVTPPSDTVTTQDPETDPPVVDNPTTPTDTGTTTQDPVTAPPAVPGAQLTDDQIIAVMKAFIQGGTIKEFKFEDVIGWEASPNVERDGEVYQAGLIDYKTETLFGVTEVEAQALIKDGKVVMLIWPKSGIEIN